MMEQVEPFVIDIRRSNSMIFGFGCPEPVGRSGNRCRTGRRECRWTSSPTRVATGSRGTTGAPPSSGIPAVRRRGERLGTSVSTCIGSQHPERLIGLHLVPPLVPPDRDAPDLSSAERASQADLAERTRTGSGYSAIHATRPQTVGYGLCDSPAGLAAWILEKLSTWTDPAARRPTLDQMLDNISVYWFTGTAASSARLYWESIGGLSRWFSSDAGDPIGVPTGCSVFPKEVPRPSRRWAARRLPAIVHWSEPDRGGHFPGWEQPELLARDLRDTIRAIG